METDFAEEHKKTVSMYVQVSSVFSMHKGVKQVYCPNGFRFVLCTTPSSTYKIPLEIRELLKLSGFRKLHAEPITLKLKHDTILNHRVTEFCGIPWNHVTCNGCNRYMDPLEDKWVIPYTRTLCGMCALPNKDEYVLSHASDFCISDWIQFMECDGGAFFVNCNPHHADYRNIIHGVALFADASETVFDMVGKADELLALIQTWIALTPLSIGVSSEKDRELYHHGVSPDTMNAFLDSRVTNSDTIYTARRYGVVPSDGVPTFRMVLENRPKGVSENLLKDEIDRIKGMRALGIDAIGSTSQGTFFYDSLTDEDVTQIARQMMIDDSQEPVFTDGDVRYVQSNMSQHFMYEDPTLRSFSIWLFRHYRHSR